MSKPVSIAVAKPLSTGFIRTLIFGSLCVATAMAAHNSSVRIAPHATTAVVHRPIPTPVIVPPQQPEPAQPSTYHEESAMSSNRLLNRWDNFITEASQRFNVPKDWIRAVMARESGGRTMLRSRAGAVGLMQMLPQTYHAMAAKLQLGANPFDAHDNIMAATAYLDLLHHKYGFPAMFAAYNAGPGKLEGHLEHGERLPAETRAYVGAITKTLHVAASLPEQADASPPERTARSLPEPAVSSLPATVTFTQPYGATVKVDPSQVVAVRAPLPGEYEGAIKAVMTLASHSKLGILESVASARAAIGHPAA